MEFIDITKYVMLLAALVLFAIAIRKSIVFKGNKEAKNTYVLLSFLYGALIFFILAARVTIFVSFD